MKKLMIAVVAVAMAAVASAATTNWKFSTGTSVLTDVDGNVMNGATVYLMINTAASGTTDKTSQQAVLAGLRDGTMTESDIAKAAAAQGTTDKDGKIIPDNAIPFSRDDVTGTKGYFYELVVDGDNVYMTNLIGVTTPESEKITADVKPSSGASTNIRDTDGTLPYNNPGWYSTVPEPTSGLLLLLGVAGLALRRRRA